MAIIFPDLPYDVSELEPNISKQTLLYHYGKHHKKYVDTLNKLIKGTRYDDMKLDEIVLESAGREDEKKIYNNAAQAWNHEFYWQCMTRPAGEKPDGRLAKELGRAFGGLDPFLEDFARKGTEHFGSGWVWLVKNRDGKLDICSMSDAGNPLVEGKIPLLVCDVWEHAFYLDYKNEKEKYAKAFLPLINWDFVERNFEESSTDARRLERRERPTELRS